MLEQEILDNFKGQPLVYLLDIEIARPTRPTRSTSGKKEIIKAYKVGYSLDISNRVRKLKRLNSRESAVRGLKYKVMRLEVVDVTICADKGAAVRLEGELHRQLGALRKYVKVLPNGNSELFHRIERVREVFERIGQG